MDNRTITVRGNSPRQHMFATTSKEQPAHRQYSYITSMYSILIITVHKS